MSDIGSKEWFTEQADKLVDAGLAIAKYKIIGTGPTGDAANTAKTDSTFNNALTGKLPYILGAAALVGIIVILAKR